MLSLFRKSSAVELKSPVAGKAKELSKIQDPVFSSKIMGEGIAIEPSEDMLYSPANGVVSHVFPTKHAVGIVTDEGIEVLLHIGIDTVGLKGEGFESFVRENDRVKVGDRLISFDIDTIKSKAKSTTTVMIITNMDIVESIDFKYGDVDNRSSVIVIKTKEN